ncbi:MAG: hypothetical protein WC370_10945 [Dehalococcoidales bacterium]|jgi:hypothetical protein
MSDTKKKILEMLAQNKISADEAYRLLNALNDDGNGTNNSGHDNRGHEDGGPGMKVKTKAKYLRVSITPREGDEVEDACGRRHADKVNVRVPMSLIRAGIKMKSLIPPEAKDKINGALHEKGIDFDIDSIKNEDIEELIESLGDMEVDIEGKNGEKVKVYVE